MRAGVAAGMVCALALSLSGAFAEPADAGLPKRDVLCGDPGAPRGTLIALHPGAFWIAYTKPFLEAFCRRMKGGGFRVIAVAYPPNTRLALARVRRVAAAERLRGRRVFAYGESAGGTYAEMLALAGRVDAAVAVAAPSDLLEWEAGNLGYWQGLMKMTPAGRRAASPIFHVSGRAAPLLLMHSPADATVGFAHSVRLHRAAPRTRLLRVRGGHLADCTVRPRAVRWLSRRFGGAAGSGGPHPSCPAP